MPADTGSAGLALATARFFADRAQQEMLALRQEAVEVQRALQSDLESVIKSRANRGASDPVQRASGSDPSHEAFEAFKHYLEAAIVFGRSVTFRLQAEYKHLPSFEPWYAERRSLMNHDPLFTFFRDERNLVLKKREVSIDRAISVTVETSGGFSTRTVGGVRSVSVSRSMSVEWDDIIFFENSEWEDQQALTLLTEYLDGLEATVDSARSQFG